MWFRRRDAESCEPHSNLLWDSVFYNRPDASGGYADWIMAGKSDPAEQRGGLRARMQLATAVMICLFTDKRLPAGMTPPGDDNDPRGWWGDGVRLDGEPAAEMGSLLWTLERGTLDADTARLAKDFAEESLQVLIKQGAAARFEVTTSADIERGFLGIKVRAFNHLGQPLDSGNLVYQVVWNQIANPAQMTFASPT